MSYVTKSGRMATAFLILIVCLSTARTSRAEQEALLIGPSDSLFMSMINDDFPGLSSTDYFSQLSPYMALLRNDGTSPLKAYMVDWTATTAGGAVRTFNQDFVDRFFMAPEYHRPIQPASIRLVSPLFNLSPSEYRELAKKNLLEVFYPAVTLPPFRTLVSMTVSLDGVVWADGIFKGPNKHRSLDEYRCVRNADHDEAVAVMNAASDQMNPMAVTNLLEHDIAAGRRRVGLSSLDVSPSLASEYVEERARSATALRRMLSSRGIAILRQRTSSVAGRFPSSQPTRMASWMP